MEIRGCLRVASFFFGPISSPAFPKRKEATHHGQPLNAV